MYIPAKDEIVYVCRIILVIIGLYRKPGMGNLGREWGMGNGERGMGIKSRNPLYKLFIQTLRDFVDTCHALSRTPMLKH